MNSCLWIEYEQVAANLFPATDAFAIGRGAGDDWICRRAAGGGVAFAGGGARGGYWESHVAAFAAVSGASEAGGAVLFERRAVACGFAGLQTCAGEVCRQAGAGRQSSHRAKDGR